MDQNSSQVNINQQCIGNPDLENSFKKEVIQRDLDTSIQSDQLCFTPVIKKQNTDQLIDTASPIGKYVPLSQSTQFPNQISFQNNYMPPASPHTNFRHGDQKSHVSRNLSEAQSFQLNNRNSSTGQQFVDLTQHRRRSKQLSVDRAIIPEQLGKANTTNAKVDSLVNNWNQQKHEKYQNNIFSTPTSQTANTSFQQITSFMMNTSQHSIIQELPEFMDSPTPKKSVIAPVQEEDENLIGTEDYDKHKPKSQMHLEHDLKSTDRKNGQRNSQKDFSSSRQSKQTTFTSIHIEQRIKIKINMKAKFEDKQSMKVSLARPQSKQINTSRPLTTRNTTAQPKISKIMKTQPVISQQSLRTTQHKSIKIQTTEFHELSNKSQTLKTNHPYTPQYDKQPIPTLIMRLQPEIIKTPNQQTKLDRGRKEKIVQKQTSLISNPLSKKQSEQNFFEFQKEPSELLTELKNLKLSIQLAYEKADKCKASHNNSQFLIQSNLDQIIKVMQLDFECFEQRPENV